MSGTLAWTFQTHSSKSAFCPKHWHLIFFLAAYQTYILARCGVLSDDLTAVCWSKIIAYALRMSRHVAWHTSFDSAPGIYFEQPQLNAANWYDVLLPHLVPLVSTMARNPSWVEWTRGCIQGWAHKWYEQYRHFEPHRNKRYNGYNLYPKMAGKWMFIPENM